MNGSRPRPIIVGVEGSERSADALALADLLAVSLGGQLLLVHAHPYGPLSSILGETEYEKLVREVADSTFFQAKARISEGREREMRLVAAGSPAEGLQRVAEQENAGLIVVGSSHRSGLGRVLPGSVGERLLSGAPAPVAVAPRGYTDSNQRLEVIACAFDGSPESRLALSWAADLARVGDKRLVLISVHTPIAFGHVGARGAFSLESANQSLRRDLEREQREAITAMSIGAEGVIADGDAAARIAETARDADILVIGSRGYGPLRSVLLGSTSQRLLRTAACPVIVCPRAAGVESPLADEARP